MPKDIDAEADGPFVPSDRKKTDEIDPKDVRVSWPVAISTLDQIDPRMVFALRLGTLALIQECVRAMAQRDAKFHLVERMRELVESLAKMPWETPA